MDVCYCIPNQITGRENSHEKLKPLTYYNCPRPEPIVLKVLEPPENG
jgi:hypothetical protein